MCTLKFEKHCPDPIFAFIRIGTYVQLWRLCSSSLSSLNSRTHLGIEEIALILKLTPEHSSVVFFFISKIVICNYDSSIRNPDITVFSCLVSEFTGVWNKKGKGERSNPLYHTLFGDNSDSVETRGWQNLFSKTPHHHYGFLGQSISGATTQLRCGRMKEVPTFTSSIEFFFLIYF